MSGPVVAQPRSPELGVPLVRCFQLDVLMPEDDMENMAEPGRDLESLRAALDEQSKKSETLLGNWQRATADLANYRKRMEQEKQETTAFANAQIISRLLPAMDDFTRAFETIDQKLKEETWVEGMRLIYRKLQSILEAQGVQVIPTVGQPFDPNFHEAVMEMDGEQGLVVSEMAKGYKLRDKVLRPAVVAVGRGNPAGKESGPRSDNEGSSNG